LGCILTIIARFYLGDRENVLFGRSLRSGRKFYPGHLFFMPSFRISTRILAMAE